MPSGRTYGSSRTYGGRSGPRVYGGKKEGTAPIGESASYQSEPFSITKDRGVGDYVNQRVPVESFSKDSIDRGPVIAVPEVGIRWGRPASLKFNLGNQIGQEVEEPPSNAVVEDFDETEYLTGRGVSQATDHFGQVVAESPMFDGDTTRPHFYTVFECEHFEEEDEERETAPTGVVFITPITRKIRQYLQWDDIPDFLPYEKFRAAFNYDGGNNPPGRTTTAVPVNITVTWQEPRPKQYIGQLGEGIKRYRYIMNNATRYP